MLDCVFPVACVGCSAPDTWLCDACAQHRQILRPTCIGCGIPTLHGVTCGQCHSGVALRGLVAVGPYRDPTLQSAVHALKFEGVRDLAVPLATLLTATVQSALASTLHQFTIVPLPLHPRRERWRGFNQSMLLATAVATRLNLPLNTLLVRTRFSAPQSSIDTSHSTARRENVAGVFRFTDQEKRAPADCLLIDDVVTTGATLEAAARVLYDHGALHVWGAVLCRG